jgi:hypothetical protein
MGVLSAAAVQARPDEAYIRGHAVRAPIWNQALSGRKVVMVGELHGTNEIPDAYAEMARNFAFHGRKVLAALEVPNAYQKDIDAFFAGGGIETLRAHPFFTEPYQDGRSSHRMLKLLAQLRLIPALTVFCFDPYKRMEALSDRNYKMAVLLQGARERLKPDVTLVLAGNLHTRVTVGSPFDPAFRAMGVELLAIDLSLNLSNLASLLVRYEGGTAWICVDNGCGMRPVDTGGTPYSRAVDWPRYLLHEPEPTDGHTDTLFLRKLTGSPPFIAPH